MIGIGLVLVFAIFLAYKTGFFAEAGLERLLEVFQRPLTEVAGARLMIWVDALRLGMQRPFHGWGFGISGGLVQKDLHSNYLRVFVELGITGLIIWSVLLVMLAASAMRAPYGSTAFLMGALVGAMILSGVTLNTLNAKASMYEMGLILAMRGIFGTARNPREELGRYGQQELAGLGAYA